MDAPASLRTCVEIREFVTPSSRRSYGDNITLISTRWRARSANRTAWRVRPGAASARDAKSTTKQPPFRGLIRSTGVSARNAATSLWQLRSRPAPAADH